MWSYLAVCVLVATLLRLRSRLDWRQRSAL